MQWMTVFCTVGTEEEGSKIAAALVEERLAACVNMIPGVRSFYRWQGKICTDGEYLLMIKTRSDQWEDLQDRIAALHSYDLPEILRLDVAGASEGYLRWLGKSLDEENAPEG